MSDEMVRADADVSGTTTLDVGGELSVVQEGEEAQLLAPGVDLRITQAGELDVLPADVYEELSSMPPVDEEGEPVEEVRAAEGQVFLAASFASDDPRWEPRGELPDSEARLLVGGNVVEPVFSTRESTKHSGTVVVSVDEDTSTDEVALEVETDEMHQELSLSDGQRLSSDVEHIYQAVGADVEFDSLEDFDSFEETFPGWTGDTQRISGTVEGAFVTPWIGGDSDGDGWPGSGKVYLSVEIDWADSASTTDDNSAVHVELDDGTVVHPENDPSSLKNVFAENAIFEVPADVESATLVVTPSIEIVSGDHAGVQEWDPLSAELTID